MRAECRLIVIRGWVFVSMSFNLFQSNRRNKVCQLCLSELGGGGCLLSPINFGCVLSSLHHVPSVSVWPFVIRKRKYVGPTISPYEYKYKYQWGPTTVSTWDTGSTIQQIIVEIIYVQAYLLYMHSVQ